MRANESSTGARVDVFLQVFFFSSLHQRHHSRYAARSATTWNRRASRRGKTPPNKEKEESNKEMDEELIPEHEHLLTFVRKLKEVFDICDEDSDGFIQREHLVQLGSELGHGDQVRTGVLLGLFTGVFFFSLTVHFFSDMASGLNSILR